jgi:multidrug efflux system membrane fusion protein
MNKSILSALIVVLILAVWMISGVASDNPDKTIKPDTHSAEQTMKVSVLNSKLKTVQRFVTLQGQVEANRVVDIKVEVDGRVANLPVLQGERVEQGVSLVTLSADYRLKQLAKAKSLVRQESNDLSATTKLKKRGLIADNKVIEDQVALSSAQADLAVIQYEVDSANVYSPFSGVLNSRTIEIGDYLQKGDVIGTLVDDRLLKVTGQLPQQNSANLQLNESVAINLSNGLATFGKLTYISRVADSVTRSYRVEVSVDNPTLQRFAGLTASLKIPLGTQKGHLLPSSALGLAVNGNLQIKIVTPEQRVKTVDVELIRTDGNGFWLSGLDHDAQVITQGKDFVSDGQAVEPIIEEKNDTNTADVRLETKVSTNG